MASKQSYIVLANMLTTAAYLGIGIIEGFNRRPMDRRFADEGLMDSEHFGVSVMVGFGYRGEQPLREKTRQPLDDLVLWKWVSADCGWDANRARKIAGVVFLPPVGLLCRRKADRSRKETRCRWK